MGSVITPNLEKANKEKVLLVQTSFDEKLRPSKITAYIRVQNQIN